MFNSIQEINKFLNKLPRKRRQITEIYAERMRFLMEQLKCPEKKLKVVHITGTSGKGSTAAMISSVLKESGYKVGMHTSPHLQSIRERTIINGEPIDAKTYIRTANRVKKAYDAVIAKGSYGDPDYYQFLTAISLYIFAQQKVDIAVVEVGAGGYGDSTNIFKPVVSVVTNVGLDHVGYLGKTIEDITMVKAGIIKPKSTVISAATQLKVKRILLSRAKELKCPYYSVDKIFKYKVKKITPQYTIADIANGMFRAKNIKIGLTGTFQVRNATIAVLTAKVLKRKYNFSKIKQSTIIKGLENVTIPGRFETIQDQPMVVLDAAHNIDKMTSLVKLANQLFTDKTVNLLIGFKGNKDFPGMLKILGTIKNPGSVIVTRTSAEDERKIKFADVKEVADEARKYFQNVIIKTTPKMAIKESLKCAKDGGVVLVTGSMYLVGELRNLWVKVE